MKKLEIKLIANLATIFLLCVTLFISISFGWYTNNKEVHANGLYASSASENLMVTNQGVYSTQIGKGEPNPNDPNLEKDKEVTGVLAGEVVYFSFSISSTEEGETLSLNDLKIAVTSIFGDEYFTEKAVKYSKPESGYNLLEPTEGNKKSIYERKERAIHSILTYNDEEYYISRSADDQGYVIYYVDVDDSGDVKVTSFNDLTDEQYAIYSQGVTTGYKYVYDEIESYPTYIDPSNNKEYYITHVDGIDYINYIYETDNGNTRYNMIDIYTYELYKVYGRNDLTDKSEDAYELYFSSEEYEAVGFTKANGLDKSIQMFTLCDPTYLTTHLSDNMDSDKLNEVLYKEYKELTYVFKFVFNYDEYDDVINTSSVSYREIKFNNVIISFYDEDGGDE